MPQTFRTALSTTTMTSDVPAGPSVFDKIAYINDRLDEAFALLVEANYVHAGGRQNAGGETAFMFSTGGWMTVEGAVKAGALDHIIPPDLSGDLVRPASASPLVSADVTA